MLLRQKLDALAKRLFGKSSEQLDPAQLQLLLQGLHEPGKSEASSGEKPSEPEEAAGSKRKKTKGKNNSRIRGLGQLEVEEETVFPAEYEANPDAFEILGPDFNGIIQCDGYSAYVSYERTSKGEIILGSCMAHIRRKFHEALEAKERHAALIIKLVGNSYHIEEKLRQQRAGPALRDAVWASEVQPILKRFLKIITVIKARHLPQSRMGQAIKCALGQWSGLDCYLADGRVELDNNLIENGIRPTKLGQKNWLFLGSERGGELAAVSFTIIESCKRYRIPLRDYLATTMKAIIEQGPDAAPLLTPQALATHPSGAAKKFAA